MLYTFLKLPAAFALPLYCRKLSINNKNYTASSGPLLLACNHPNSFLDAVVLATVFKKPVYSLARGDTFQKKWAAFLLHQLNILPVYRQREGAEHLHKNYHTFDACLEIFKQGGIVLIFSEAMCENEWHLRPLKKGTARLAAAAWQQGIDLKILPVGINYSSFKIFGKSIQLNFGSFIGQKDMPPDTENGKLLNDVTGSVQQQLNGLVYEIEKNDTVKQEAIFAAEIRDLKKIILSVPAAAGYLLHAPLYLPVKKIAAAKTLHTVHYDSIMVGLLFLSYPFYLLLLCVIMYWIAGSFWWLLIPVTAPFCAWSCVQLKTN